MTTNENDLATTGEERADALKDALPVEDATEAVVEEAAEVAESAPAEEAMAAVEEEAAAEVAVEAVEDDVAEEAVAEVVGGLADDAGCVRRRRRCRRR